MTIDATTTTSAEVSAATVGQLRSRVRGGLILARDRGYDEARAVYNGRSHRTRPDVRGRGVSFGEIRASCDTTPRPQPLQAPCWRRATNPLPSLRVGRHLRFERAALDAWLARARQAAR